MSAVFVDANVPMYAAGPEDELRAPCRAILKAIGDGRLVGVTSVEVLQEILHRYFMLGRRAEGLAVFDSFRSLFVSEILAVETLDVDRARSLADMHPLLAARDLVHLATMERHGLTAIVTADRHFDELTEVERLDPAALAQRLRRQS